MRFQFWNSSQLRPLCCSSHCQEERRLCMEALPHALVCPVGLTTHTQWSQLRTLLLSTIHSALNTERTVFHFPNHYTSVHKSWLFPSKPHLFVPTATTLLQVIVKSCFKCLLGLLCSAPSTPFFYFISKSMSGNSLSVSSTDPEGWGHRGSFCYVQ